MTQQLHGRSGVIVGDGANSDESRTMAAAAAEMPVESRTTTGVAQRRRLPVASAHNQIGLGFFGGFGGARRTSCCVSPASTSLYSTAQRGPTNHVLGWAPLIRARVKGPNVAVGPCLVENNLTLTGLCPDATGRSEL